MTITTVICLVLSVIFVVARLYLSEKFRVVKTIVFDFPKGIAPIDVAFVTDFYDGGIPIFHDGYRGERVIIQSLLCLVAFTMLPKGYVTIVKEKEHICLYTIRKKHLTENEINEMSLIEKACYNSLPFEEDVIGFNECRYFYGNTQFEYFVKQKKRVYVQVNKNFWILAIVFSCILLFFEFYILAPFVFFGFFALALFFLVKKRFLFNFLFYFLVKIFVLISLYAFIFLVAQDHLFVTREECVFINLTVFILSVCTVSLPMRTKKANEVLSISLGFKKFAKKVDLEKINRKKYFETYLPYLIALNGMSTFYMESAYKYYKNKKYKNEGQ